MATSENVAKVRSVVNGAFAPAKLPGWRWAGGVKFVLDLMNIIGTGETAPLRACRRPLENEIGSGDHARCRCRWRTDAESD